jgi:hypothetical protein
MSFLIWLLKIFLAILLKPTCPLFAIYFCSSLNESKSRQHVTRTTWSILQCRLYIACVVLVQNCPSPYFMLLCFSQRNCKIISVMIQPEDRSDERLIIKRSVGVMTAISSVCTTVPPYYYYYSISSSIKRPRIQDIHHIFRGKNVLF